MFPASASLLAAVAAVCLAPVVAQPTSATTEKSTVWMPPRSTRAGENIYASVITAVPSSAELFLACTSVWQSASACSQFSGVTLTYGDNTIKIEFKSDFYDCKRGDSATCSIGASNSAAAQSVLASSESAAWFTAITIVDGHDKLKSAKAGTSAATSTGPASAATTTSADSNGVCKRAVKGSGSDSSSGSGSGSGSGTKPKGNGGATKCSAASGEFVGLPSTVAAAVVVAGGLVALFL
ncbi:hypothetical protein LY78DRAFT_706719 [Colletotrichum sublineola]|uniref:Uncharacterized protein n=1 Tax=Colletotrichum sublineola TaxID=1173701 RepID=A0A066X3F9_COLSU|nr:hypothetical protein LY78DRAFT_706719 [Colletotrichum sublineola]KDN60271.1 hypothetical protein CSUB01_10271 [Colletotrichum sublineola]